MSDQLREAIAKALGGGMTGTALASDVLAAIESLVVPRSEYERVDAQREAFGERLRGGWIPVVVAQKWRRNPMAWESEPMSPDEVRWFTDQEARRG